MSNIAQLKQNARSLEQREQWKAALDVYEQMVREAGSEELEVGLWNRVGDLHMRLSQTSQAVAAYERAVDAYADAGLHNNALALCNKILRVNPTRTPVFLKLGLISAIKGFAADARQFLGGYLDQMAASGDLDAAVAALIEHADAQPDDEPHVRSVVAEQIRDRGHAAEALRLLHAAFHIHRERDQEREADRVWELIRELDGGADAAPAAQAVRAPRPASAPQKEVALLDLDALAGGDAGAPAPAPEPAASRPESNDGFALEEITLLDGFESTIEASEVEETEPLALADLEHAAGNAAAAETGGDGITLLTGLVDSTPLAGLEIDPLPADEDDETDAGDADALPLLSFGSDDLGTEVEPLGGLEPTLAGADFEEAPADDEMPLLGGTELHFLGGSDAEDEQEDEDDARADDDFAADLPPVELILPDAFGAEQEEGEDAEEAAHGALPLLDLSGYEPEEEYDGEAADSLAALESGSELELIGWGGEEDADAEDDADADALPWIAAPESVSEAAASDDLAVEDEEVAAVDEIDAVDAAEADVELPLATADPLEPLRQRLAADPGDRDAVDALAAAMRSGPLDLASALAMECAADALEAGGRIGEALGIVRTLLSLRPTETALFQRQVELAVRSGETTVLIEAYLALADHLGADGDGAKTTAVYERVLELDPDHHVARRALGFPERSVSPDEGYIDLAALIFEDEPATGSTRFVVEAEEPSGDEDHDFAEILARFREQVAQNLDANDSASHYDLGVAFKEMGLLSEAISEFQTALRAGSHPLATLEMLGECFVGQEQHAVGWRVLDRAIRLSGAPDAELVGVLYWMGRCDEALGRPDAAAACFERVLSVDIGFRDAAERLREVRTAAPRGAF